MKENYPEKRAVSAASNVVLPSQSFEYEMNNLVLIEMDEGVEAVNRREPNQPKKADRVND